MNDDKRSALFARARGAGAPTDEDRRRVRAGLARKLGMAAGAVVGTTTAKAAGLAGAVSTTGLGASTMPIVKAAAVALALATAAFVWHEHSSPDPTSAPIGAFSQSRPLTQSVSATARASPPAPSPSPDLSQPARAPTPPVAWRPVTAALPVGTPAEQAPTNLPVSTASPFLDQAPGVASPRTAPIEGTADSLDGNVNPMPSASASLTPSARGNAEELALIRQMQEALRAGDAARTLTVVREHERQFPSGQFSPEREGVKVIALCMGASGDKAAAQGRVFLDSHPRSPLAARVRATCGLGGANDFDTGRGESGQ